MRMGGSGRSWLMVKSPLQKSIQLSRFKKIISHFSQPGLLIITTKIKQFFKFRLPFSSR